MTLVRYNKNRNEFPTTVNGLMDKFFNDASFDNTRMEKFAPSVDVLESEKSYELHFAVPGFDKKSFNIDVEENVLAISGERKFEEKKEEKEFTSIQTQYGSFRRTFSLPDIVDRTKIGAEYVDGILKVTLPKDEVKVLKTTVKVK
ncbi:MAG: Hsp20/alpha crystallin family protein [Cyclobacteriaceae bacterium]|nr:Hsp20/alpha crystallin family protein [Cyclobacteriaceae bacterium]